MRGNTILAYSQRIVNNSMGRLKYTERKPRTFSATSSISAIITRNNTAAYIFYFVKYKTDSPTEAPTELKETTTYIDSNGAFAINFSVSGNIKLMPNESVELYGKEKKGNPIK